MPEPFAQPLSRRRHLQTALSVALAAGLLGLFLANVDLPSVVRRIQELRLGPALVALALSVLNVAIRAWRWQRILGPVGRVRFREVFSATSIGFAAVTLLPARIGEVIRPFVLSRRARLPLSSCLASVVFERIADMATILLFFVFYALSAAPPLSGEAARHFSLVRGAGFLGAAVLAGILLALTIGRRRAADRFVAAVVRCAPARFRSRLSSVASAFLDGFLVLGNREALAGTVVGSLALWGSVYGMIFALYRAFSLSLPFSSTFAVLAVTVIGLLLPTPGGIGGFHKACQIALVYFYGVPIATATGLAIVYHLVAFAPVTLMGLVAFAAGPGKRESLTQLAEEAGAGARW